MKILVISDLESEILWERYRPELLNNVDLILSCGDLDPDYLSFIASMAKCPLFYVHGNHDGKYIENPPEGCICVEDQIYTYKGIRILGLGGSMFYGGENFQYSEKEMQKRVRKLQFQLWKTKGFDILLTHAPLRGLNDTDTPAHRGFEVFGKLIEEYDPKYFVHGHVHMNYDYRIPRICQHKNTTVINGYEYYSFYYE